MCSLAALSSPLDKKAYLCKDKGLILKDILLKNKLLEYIIPKNCNIIVPEDRYEKKDIYIQSAKAFGRNMFRPIFIVDMFKKEFMYISEDLSDIFWNDPIVQTNDQIVNSFHRVFEKESLENLRVILAKAYEMFLSFPVKERSKIVFSFHFNHEFGGEKKVCHRRMTPLALTEDGDLWLVLCTTSLSSIKHLGYYEMKIHGENEYLQYYPDKDRWYHKEGEVLTFAEKKILYLSSQGYTMKEIATIFNKSEDSIKLYKREMFKKLDVNSITEAVFAAINYNKI